VFQSAQKPPTEARTKRLLKELKLAAAVQDPNAEAVDTSGAPAEIFDPELRIYPFANDINQWRIFLQSRDDSSYGGKWWYMTVSFPPAWPTEPPIFRFISIPYHMNVSEEGRVCLNAIERGYVPRALVIDLIQTVKQVFLIPDTNTPVQAMKWTMFKDQRMEYDRLAWESAVREARNSPEEWLAGLGLSDDVPAGFKLDQLVFVPAHERSPFTGEPIPIDKRILSSTGIFYNRDELRQYILSTPNPICAVTGKRLKETADDFKD
jgi:ubiquitin-protein ligase